MLSDSKFKNRIYDKALQAEREYRYTYTDFLTPGEQSELLSFVPGLSAGVSLFGGYDGAERRVARFGAEGEFGYTEDYPIAILSIKPVSEKYAGELKHRDYLGALLNLGIDRRVTGDIVISGREAWVFCLDHISGFITESLTRVRHTSVRTIEVTSLPDIVCAPPEESIVFVPSLRVDAVIARAFRLSRGDAQKAVEAERVFVNSLPVLSSSHMIREGDLVSVRGKGRFRYTGSVQQTKKGNLRIGLQIYK